MKTSSEKDLIGTAAYDNWRAFINKEPCLVTVEYPLFTDARLTGEVIREVEPYNFFNLVPNDRQLARVREAVMLRLSIHVNFKTPDVIKTDSSCYHGGWMIDEITALSSLKCGVRFRQGGQSRRFEKDGDPQGRPIAWDYRPDPILNIGVNGFVLPTVMGEHSMEPIAELRSFPLLSPEQAITLVRAARLYQDALWLAESEPSLSWLMFVSAIETAASHWRATRNDSLERLKVSCPEFVEYLEETGVEGIAERVAGEFADSIGATKKFVDFLLEFLPPPPDRRPESWAQIDWSKESFRRVFKIIYGYRSKALHDGIPFPSPMCMPPYIIDPGGIFSECPPGLAASGYGGTWLAEDTPLLLNTFEYITRLSLNAWWQSMETGSTDYNRR